jgi:hypothetical protein
MITLYPEGYIEDLRHHWVCFYSSEPNYREDIVKIITEHEDAEFLVNKRHTIRYCPFCGRNLKGRDGND